jgi:hypothetical protein
MIILEEKIRFLDDMFRSILSKISSPEGYWDWAGQASTARMNITVKSFTFPAP